MDIILHYGLLGLVIFAVAQSLPGIRINGFGTAIIVSVVYGLVNLILGSVLKFLSFPLIFLTLGLFTLLINTFLLWVTDKIIDDFEIDDIGTTFIAAVIITLADVVLGFFF